MNLDDFKSSWDSFPDASAHQQETNRMKTLQIIENGTTDRLLQQSKRYKLMSLWFLALPIILFFLFYLMSDGFTNSQDSPGALMVNLVLLVPFLIFFGTRYFRTQQVADLKDIAVRNYLPKVIGSLQANQKGELIVLGIVVGLSLIGLFITLLFNTAVSPWLLSITGVLAIGLTYKAWQDYETQKGELNSYLEQLNEMAQSDEA